MLYDVYINVGKKGGELMNRKYKLESWSLNDIAFAMKNSDDEGRKIIIPIFQRGKRWDKCLKEDLLDSLLKGYPVGTLLFAEKGNKTYSVVDGLQRCTTVCEYILNPTLRENLHDIDSNILTACRTIFFPDNENLTINTKINSTILNFISKHKSFDEIEVGDIAEELYSEIKGNDNDRFREITKQLKDVLKPWYAAYKADFESIKQTEIPVIVYVGNNEYLNDIFSRINKKGKDLTDYEIYAATWNLNRYTINDQDIIEAVIKKYDNLALDDYTIEEYDSNEIRKQRQLTAFEFLFGFGKAIIKKYDFLDLDKPKEDDEISEIGFELIDACLNNTKNVCNLADIIRDEHINLNLLNRRLNEAISFVKDTLAPICTFRGNSRKKIQFLHPKYLILALIAFTFREMYDINDMNQKKDSWEISKTKIKKNLLTHYVFGIVRNEWHDGGIGKMYSAIRERSFLEDYEKSQWESMLNGYFESQLLYRQLKKFSNPSNADKLLLNCIYTDIFTVKDNCSDTYYDIEHLATKKRMENLMQSAGCIKGLPVAHIANLCYLPAGINRKKKDKTIYEDQYISMPIEEVENKYSFTTNQDFDFLYYPYKNGDCQKLEDSYMAFLRDRFDVQKQRIYHSLQIK